MKKIAIVGVEGSGKTVMMAAMGEQWERPDERGYFLSPENAEAFGFAKSVMGILRSGRWPSASSHDEMRLLEWSLQRRQGGDLEKIADVSMLDYAGEVYRQAFGGERREGYDEQVATLRSHVDEADVLIVLVNLSDVINGSMANRRTRDAMWLTKSVLDYALCDKPRRPHAAIVFTQADSYREIISANGGAAATLKKYLPHVANLYDDLPIFTASAIDRTVIGSDGLPIPAPDFMSIGLNELMSWMISIGEADRAEECRKDCEHSMADVEQERERCDEAAKMLIAEGTPLLHLGYGQPHRIQYRIVNRDLGWLMSFRLSIVVLLSAIVSCVVMLYCVDWSATDKNEFYICMYGISIPYLILTLLLHIFRRIRTFNVLGCFSNGRWHKALNYKRLICSGDGGVLYYKAICHLLGLGGLPINYDVATTLLHKGATLGVAESLVALGWMAEKGMGMPQSTERAKQYYEEARSMGAKDVPEPKAIMSP